MRGSYVQGRAIQELLQFSRWYVRLGEQSPRIEQEIDCQLHRSNIQITNYTTKKGSADYSHVWPFAVPCIVSIQMNHNQGYNCQIVPV